MAAAVVGKAKPGHTFSYVIHSHDYARERVAGIMKVGQIDSCTFARFCVYLLLDRGGTRYCAELQHFLLVCLKFPFFSPLSYRLVRISRPVFREYPRTERGRLRNKLGDTVSPPWRVTALMESSARRRDVSFLTTKRLNDPNL